MRIGISTSVIQRGRTGIAQYVFALLRALAAQESPHEFTLFGLEEDLPLFEFVRNRMRLVPVPERFRPPLNNIAWHQACLPRLIRRHRLDLLHVPSYRRLLGTKPCRLVATIHDLAPFQVEQKYDWKRMLYGRVIAKWLTRRQDAIIAISHNTARDISRYFHIHPDRLTVIHNGLDHDRFFPDDREQARTRVAARYALQLPFFLYLARLEHPAKNHVGLLAAFARFKAETRSEWQLVFAGSDWHGAEVIHRAIRNSNVARDVRALGFVPDQALAELYRAADAFVYPSLYEGFGLPPLEAMACGCPVISSVCGALGEVIGKAAATVDPLSLESLAGQLHRVATDSAERARLSAAGLLQARKFNWDRTAKATLEVYERTASLAEKVLAPPITLQAGSHR